MLIARLNSAQIFLVKDKLRLTRLSFIGFNSSTLHFEANNKSRGVFLYFVRHQSR